MANLVPMNAPDPDRETHGEIQQRGRFMGIDLGAARVGIALSDLSGLLASPMQALRRGESDEAMINQILELAEIEEVSAIVIGIPINLTPSKNIAENSTRKFMAELASKTSLPVIGYDERFTTVIASKRLRESGHNSKTMKSKIDAMAAAEILQSYLDSRA